MRMVKIKVFLLLLLFAIASDLRAADQKVTVKDSEFEKRVEVVGPSVSLPKGLYFLRSWVDKTNGTSEHQIYFAEVYSNNEWKHWRAASDDTGEALVVVSIKRDVSSCSRYRTCIYEEHIGIQVKDSVLRARATAGYRIKLRAQSGDENIIEIAPEIRSAQLGEIDNYKCLRKLGKCDRPVIANPPPLTSSAPGVSLPAPSFPDDRLQPPQPPKVQQPITAGTAFRWADADRIQNGMIESEVVAILGKPYSRSQSGAHSTLVWSYTSTAEGSKAIAFSFFNGRVVGNAVTGR